jgi:hypothetical protein
LRAGWPAGQAGAQSDQRHRGFGIRKHVSPLLF